MKAKTNWRSTIALVVLLLIAAGAFAAAVLQPSGDSTPAGWTTWDNGLKQAQQTHKKILVDVYTDWCTWCKKMDQNVYSDAKIRDYLGKNFIAIKLNAEGNEKVHYRGQEMTAAQMAGAFGVNGYPTTLFLKENGDPINVLPGYVEAPMFGTILSYIAENQYEKKSFEEYQKEKGVQPR